MSTQAVYCGTCDELLDKQALSLPESRAPCPDCGGTTRFVRLTVNATVGVRVRELLSLRATRVDCKKPIVELKQGQELRKSVGDYVHVMRRIDRENDYYEERVITEDGEVLRDIAEPLSEHVGRGSDKAARDTKR